MTALWHLGWREAGSASRGLQSDTSATGSIWTYNSSCIQERNEATATTAVPDSDDQGSPWHQTIAEAMPEKSDNPFIMYTEAKNQP